MTLVPADLKSPSAQLDPVTIASGSTRRTGGAAMRLGSQRRIDVVGLSDSNEFHFNGGNVPPDTQAGWSNGWQFALWKAMGLYASGMLGWGENGGAGLQQRGFTAMAPSAALAPNNAGGIHDQYLGNGVMPVGLNYGYLAAGAAANEPFFQAFAGGPWNFNHPLRFHFATGTFTAGAGAFQPYIRREDAVFNTYIQQAVTFQAKIDNGAGAAGNILTVTAITSNQSIGFPMLITVGAAAGTVILNQIGNPAAGFGYGGGGTYTVSGAAQLVASVAMTAVPCTNDGVGGRVVFSFLDLPANVAGAANQLGVRLGTAGTTPIGPFIGYYGRMEDKAVQAGAAYHTLYGLGGMGLWDYARNLITLTPDLSLWLLFNEARRLQILQGLNPVVVCIVNSGINDRNYAGGAQLPSWGPTGGSGVGNSAANFIDNLQGIIYRVENLYARFWPLSELSWIVMPSQPQSVPDDANLLLYRAACANLAANSSSISAIDLNALAPFNTTPAWIDSGGPSHLTQAGYQGYASLALNSLLRP